MLRNFASLVNEAVNDGFDRGVTLFMESLEVDMNKQEIFEEHGVLPVLAQLFEDAGVDVGEAMLEASEEDLDSLMTELHGA